jgi:hypothetical protein
VSNPIDPASPGPARRHSFRLSASDLLALDVCAAAREMTRSECARALVREALGKYLALQKRARKRAART